MALKKKKRQGETSDDSKESFFISSCRTSSLLCFKKAFSVFIKMWTQIFEAASDLIRCEHFRGDLYLTSGPLDLSSLQRRG